MNGWDYIFIYSSTFSPVIPIVIFLSRRYNGLFRIIISFVIASFSSDLISIFLVRGTNYPFLHGYGWVEALILFLFFYYVFDKSRWVIYTALVYSIYYLINSTFIEANTFNTLGRSTECLIIIFLSLRLFYQFFIKEEDIFLEQSPLFWINVGLLTYFSGAFFTFVLSKYILTDEPLWILHNISNILKNILIAIGLWKVKHS
ncbi:hypothetical protein [uncultured Roseivirga sp.]|mgnify:CR=1 FL=1|uniref:hypothetical protein n=1 Tax=uncultured Roseivirga sp. TaxID=543088 RepID=UPI000D7ABD13|nr:hypothetical protein [uncultured Roseivirga sp.]PWL30232.1 MAG: hypothetical protein DCO95_10400 [Roseivirga sp. XM-24bin3]